MHDVDTENRAESVNPLLMYIIYSSVKYYLEMKSKYIQNTSGAATAGCEALVCDVLAEQPVHTMHRTPETRTHLARMHAPPPREEYPTIKAWRCSKQYVRRRI